MAGCTCSSRKYVLAWEAGERKGGERFLCDLQVRVCRCCGELMCAEVLLTFCSLNTSFSFAGRSEEQVISPDGRDSF